MTATVGAKPGVGSSRGDAVLCYQAAVLARVGGPATATGGVDDATRVDRITPLQRIKATAAAAQAAEIVALTRSQVAAQQQAGVDYRQLGQGIAEQVGLATHTSGWLSVRRLILGRDLLQELSQTFALLAAGNVSEDVAQRIATKTSHLDPDTRWTVDTQLATTKVQELGPKAAAASARRLAYAADPHSAVKRAREARTALRRCHPPP